MLAKFGHGRCTENQDGGLIDQDLTISGNKFEGGSIQEPVKRNAVLFLKIEPVKRNAVFFLKIEGNWIFTSTRFI